MSADVRSPHPSQEPGRSAAHPEENYALGSGRMFDAIAPRYDLLNRIISMGIDQSWRRKTVASLEARSGSRVLDLATGTADLALAVARDGAEVVGTDPSANMLEIGRDKVRAKDLEDVVQLELGDAQAIDADDDSFDACCMAFGIRNVPDRSKALREMARVVRRGGRIAILELGEPRSGVLGPLARFHVHHVVPRIGAWLSGSKEYRYLQESIAAFPSPDNFARQMKDAGIRDVHYEALTFGVAHLYTGSAP